MQNDKNIQIIVLRANILSPNKSHVIIGNARYEIPKPINLIDQADVRCAYRNFDPKYPQTEMGMANAREMLRVL